MGSLKQAGHDVTIISRTKAPGRITWVSSFSLSQQSCLLEPNHTPLFPLFYSCDDFEYQQEYKSVKQLRGREFNGDTESFRLLCSIK